MNFSIPRYFGIYIVAAVALTIVAIALEKWTSFDLPAGMSTWFPALMAAMVEGQMFAKKPSSTFDKAAAWRDAALMTIVAIVANILFLLASLFLVEFSVAFDLLPKSWFVWIIAFLVIVTFLSNRIFFGMGFRSERKAIEIRAKKQK